MPVADLLPATRGTLLRVEQGLALLKEARNLDEVRQVHAQAEALRVLLRELGAARSAVLVATELVTRAERRQGEMTAAMEKAPSGRAAVSLPESGSQKLAALEQHGIPNQRASECEQLARIPDDEFETHVDEIKAAGKEPTRGRILERAQKKKLAPLNDGRRAADMIELPIEVGRSLTRAQALLLFEFLRSIFEEPADG